MTAVQKAQKLELIRACIAAGGDAQECCLRHGVPRGTYYRWAAKESTGGLAALHDGKSTGRPAALELTQEEASGLTAWCALKKNQESGLKAWLDDSAAPVAQRLHPELAPARPETIEGLRRILVSGKRSYPITVRRAMQVSRNISTALNGGHAPLTVKASARRAMIWVDEDGEMHHVAAGHIFSSDDMSHNEPFRYWDAAQGRESVGRQALITCDLYSHAVLGETLIGRRKDAYRVEDIASHVRDVIATAGLPLMWRFERGVWDNNYLYGLKPKPSWMLPADMVFGALDGVLFRCRQKFSPRGKSEIEGAFKLYQQLCRARFTGLGNVRGEFFYTARLYRQAIEGNAEALRKFWTMVEAQNAHAEAIAEYHATPQTRRALGNVPTTPAEAWGAPQRRAVPPSEAWRLLPVKAAGAVRNGVYECKVEHWPVSFRFLVHGTPGLPTLDYGHRVFAAFDPANPGAGCHLFNAELKEGRSVEHGRRVNREGFRLLEPLGLAAHWADVPQENLSAVASDYDPQRMAAAALRSEFRAVFPQGAAASLSRRSRFTDAAGRAHHAGPMVPREDAATAPQPAREEPAETPAPRRAPASAPAPDLVTLHRRALAARMAEDSKQLAAT